MRFWTVAALIAVASIPLLMTRKKKEVAVHPLAADDSINWDMTAD